MWPQNLLITDALGWLGYCFCGFAVCLLAWTLLRKWLHNRDAKWVNHLNRTVKAKKKFDDGMSRWWPLAFCGIWSAGMIFGITRQSPFVRETHHHIEVLKRLGPDMWLMRDDEIGEFRYTGCPDFNNAAVIWPGYIADHATWEDQGNCKSIRAEGLAFIWEHDAQGNVIKIADKEN